MGGDEHKLEVIAQAGQQSVVFGACLQCDGGLQRCTHFAIGAQSFNVFVDLIANFTNAGPLGQQCFVGRSQVAEGFHEDRLRTSESLPGFFSGKAQEGRHQAQHGMRDAVQHGLSRAACQGFRRAGVEAIFEHVQIERAQIFRAIHLQFGHHGVEFVFFEVPQNVSLQLRGTA